MVADSPEPMAGAKMLQQLLRGVPCSSLAGAVLLGLVKWCLV